MVVGTRIGYTLTQDGINECDWRAGLHNPPVSRHPFLEFANARVIMSQLPWSLN
jgi:hypothetical protein